MGSAQTPRQRNRASAACVACRKARIRCKVEEDSSECTFCIKSETDCTFDEKDGRKCRTSAKVVEEELSARIEHLEKLLKQKNGSGDVESEAERAAAVNSSAIDMVSGARGQPPPYREEESETAPTPALDDGFPQPTTSEQPSSVVRKLIPAPIRFDLSTGRVRYFGPTTSMSLLSRSSGGSGSIPTATAGSQSHWPISLIVRDLSPATHDYLMDLFWRCHNSFIHLVHLDAFFMDKQKGGSEFYSTFLHLAMLATGYRYADRTRPDIAALGNVAPGQASSVLHEKARDIAKMELDRPGGLTTIQAFSLLGELELFVGRDDTGWMFTGMSLRMVFDAGLHVDPSPLKKSELETQIRHMVLWSSLAYDKMWALYLGRPTTLKTSDVAPSCLSFDFGRILSCRPAGHEKKVGTRVYESLLGLMHVVGSMCDLHIQQRSSSTPTESYYKMAAIDQDLNNWYAQLPEDLTWSSSKQASMPPSYYLLQ